MNELFDLSGRTAVVTGARRGIGFAMATALAEAGADIIGVSASLESHGSEIEKAITSTGRNFEGIACDFADPDAVVALGERLAARQVDILVNNAGTIERAPAAEHPLASWDRVIQVNLSSQFVLAQALSTRIRGMGIVRLLYFLPLAMSWVAVSIIWRVVLHPDGLLNEVLHLDVKPLNRSQAAELDRLLALGARPVDVGQRADSSWHVLADPEGNEFCLCVPD